MARVRKGAGSTDSPSQYVIKPQGRGWAFKRRWPQEVRDRVPGLGPFLQVSLKTQDRNEAIRSAGTVMAEFERRCAEALTPTPQDRARKWLESLDTNQQGKVMALAERLLGPEIEEVAPAGTTELPEAETWPERLDGPQWSQSDLPPHPSGNPFLSVGSVG
jgi:hypothetical protein